MSKMKFNYTRILSHFKSMSILIPFTSFTTCGMLYLLYPTTSNTKDCTVPFVKEWKYHAYHLSGFDRAAMGVGLYLTKSVFVWYSTHSGQKLTNGPLVLIIMNLLAQEPCFLSPEYVQLD